MSSSDYDILEASGLVLLHAAVRWSCDWFVEYGQCPPLHRRPAGSGYPLKPVQDELARGTSCTHP